jgi:hypothetical protein
VSTAATTGITASPARQRRNRRGKYPERLDRAVPYAKSNEHLKAYAEEGILETFLKSPAWQAVMGPALKAHDEKTRYKNGKVEPAYEAWQLEAVLLYQRICGFGSYKRTRTVLASDVGAGARKLAGLNKKRNKDKVMKLRDGVPSEATMSRYRMSFAPDQSLPTFERQRAAFKARGELYAKFEQVLLEEHLKDPELRKEARLLYMDGTAVHTHYTCRITKKGEVQNDEPRRREKCGRVRVEDEQGNVVWDGVPNDEEWARIEANGGPGQRYWTITSNGGFLGYKAGRNRAGHGWNLIIICTQSGVPLVWRVVPLNYSEKRAGREVLGDLGERVMPHLGPRDEGETVLTADAGFTGNRTRKACRKIGIHENIQLVSGSDSARSKAHRAKRDKQVIPFKGKKHKDWFTNGHRELKCRCGKAHIFRRPGRDKDGAAVCRVEGSCENCGSFTVTSGQWLLAYNPMQWVQVMPWERERADLLLGNPLTFNEPLAKEFGQGRFGQQEGFFGAMSRRFGVNNGKRWVRWGEQVELEVSMTFCVMHVMAMEQRKLAADGAALGPAPPGQVIPLAA